MHGFMLPIVTKVRVSEGESFEFFPDARNDDRLVDRYPSPLQELADANPLFHDFCLRERVRSCARLIATAGGEPVATLFVNFQELRSEEDVRGTLEKLMSDLVELLPGIKVELCEHWKLRAGETLAQLTRILKPIEALGSILSEPSAGSHLEEILRAVLVAFHIEPESGFATIYVMNPLTGRLECRAASKPDLGIPRVAENESIASWVALKKRSLLIPDFEKSAFRTLQIPCTHPVRSQLAVPMISADESIGVIDVQSADPRSFNADHVRTLWHAANQAAVVLRLANQAEEQEALVRRKTALLDFYHDAAENDARDSGQLMDRLAGVIQHWASADSCSVYARSEKDELTLVGVHPSRNLNIKLRKKGWSRVALHEFRPVWVDHGPDGSGDMRGLLWREAPEDGGKPRWEKVRKGAPKGSNRHARSCRIHLGIPIPLFNEQIGIAWVHYVDRVPEPPSAEVMSELTALVGNAGMFMDIIDRYGEGARKAEELLSHQMNEIQRTLFPHHSLDNEHLQLHVRSESDGEIGGDFYAFDWLDDDQTRLAVLIGDSKGHGIPAALRMLPILTAFRLYFGKTGSTKYILERLNQVAMTMKRPEVRDASPAEEFGHAFDAAASLLYFIIDFSREKTTVYASCAGHPAMLIARAPEIRFFSGCDSPTAHAPLGIVDSPPLGEESTEVDSSCILVAVTDGITEASPDDDHTKQFDMHGVGTAVLSAKDKPAKEIADTIFTKAIQFAGGSLSDDATALVVRLKRPPKKARR